ncbi:hypothetical protein F5Y17DRAFT_452162 [Xylariaceae sp. FL0594]|nr:hypothetical protein F5Y17DRAFT_452162 [Xylariaceae sp. FL0594]
MFEKSLDFLMFRRKSKQNRATTMNNKNDIVVSNGTCYSAAGELLDESFIPCGNVAYGHQTCCGAGDNCLADNACFGYHGTGYGSQLTYMAGCTDPTFQDESCPNKLYNQSWVGLTLCDHSGGIWAPCSQKGNPTTLQPGSPCTCTDASKTAAAFTDATVLENIASLPQSTGDHISFFEGHTPTGTPTDGSPATTGAMTTGTTGTMPGSSGTTTGPTSTSGMPSNSPTPPTNGTDPGDSRGSSGLNTGAKVGIGVGVGVGVLLLLGVIAAFMYRRRMNRNSPRRDSSEDDDDEESKEVGGVPSSRVPGAGDSPVVEADGRPVQPHGVRGELDGGGIVSPNTSTTSDANGVNGGQWQKYVPYRPDAADNVRGSTAEAESTPATQPWDVRTELEGSEVPPDRLSKISGTTQAGGVTPTTAAQTQGQLQIPGQSPAQANRDRTSAELPGSGVSW